MSIRIKTTFAITSLILGGFLAFLFSISLASSELDQDSATYIGSEACAKCHQDNHKLWSESLHSRMIQTAGPQAILGDFTKNNTLEHEGSRFEMVKEGDSYVIHEWDAQGNETVFPVHYTLGSKRIQHYLSTLHDGRIRVTFPTWDVLQSRWFHSSEIIPTGDHAEVSVQIWNQHCYNCHVAQEDQGFDLASNTYKTSFTETGINCEMCHGPGSSHALRMEADAEDLNRAIVHPGKLPPDRQMMVCGQCHFPRVMVQHGYSTNKNYFDHYQPTLMQFFIDRRYDPPMWADGRMRRFATETGALWQSPCYLEGGATCISCHNPHMNTVAQDTKLHGDTNGLCTQCHESLKQKEQLASHTHHPVDSPSSQCIECHMPKEVMMMTDRERDHTISIPVPENTQKHQIPNSCTSSCHLNESAEWVIEKMNLWYPDRPTASATRADAFTLARDRDPKAVALLISLLRDRTQNRVTRGSAAGFLGEFQGKNVADALIWALADPDVVVRAEAARSLSEVRQDSAREPLTKLLSDPNLSVRVNAFFALVKMGVLDLPGPAKKDFERVRGEFETFLRDFPDVYSIRLNLGTYLAIQGKYLLALQEFRNATKLQPQMPAAHYFVGITLAQLGMYGKALESFNLTLEIDPTFRNTEEVRAKVREIMGESGP